MGVPESDLGRALNYSSAQSRWPLFFSPMSIVTFVVSDCSVLCFEFKVDFQNTLRKELNFFPVWIGIFWRLT